MKLITYIRRFIIVTFYCCAFSCEDFVEVDVPNSKIVSEVVFSNDETAIGAMKGIYNELYRSAFSNGSMSSVTVLGSLSSDNIKVIGTTNLNELEFEQKEIIATNPSNLDLWSSAYNIIYMTNSLLEGLEKSKSITPEVHQRLQGESKFVRAFTYFYLVNLYGKVPLIVTTNYQKNAIATRNSREDVFHFIIADLNDAISLLQEDYIDSERIYINAVVAKALMARVFLYQKKWIESENFSSEVIARSATYKILEDLDQVFLANSQEAIWQISTVGRGSSLTNTNEGSIFIIDPQSASSRLKFSSDMVNVLQKKDKRLSNWVGFNKERSLYYPTKYKIRNSTGDIKEYSMVLRLAEQFLIRAEARAMQGNLTGAIEDIDVIRSRAGIELIANGNPTISKEVLLDTIMKERRRELFTEWGHRWLDVKRLGQSNQIYGTGNAQWKETDTLYPIPEEERIKNPNLSQNLGY